MPSKSTRGQVTNILEAGVQATGSNNVLHAPVSVCLPIDVYQLALLGTCCRWREGLG